MLSNVQVKFLKKIVYNVAIFLLFLLISKLIDPSGTLTNLLLYISAFAATTLVYIIVVGVIIYYLLKLFLMPLQVVSLNPIISNKLLFIVSLGFSALTLCVGTYTYMP